jgi:hypothetical protein
VYLLAINSSRWAPQSKISSSRLHRFATAMEHPCAVFVKDIRNPDWKFGYIKLGQVASIREIELSRPSTV